MTISEGSILKIIIRHSTGSKANQVEPIPLGIPRDIVLGRDPSCDIVFDASRDDTVSRRHAVIHASLEPRPRFTIEDLGSSNGTFLNKKKVQAQVEILPEDVISLGYNGPSFLFEVDPRPANLVARTRVMDAVAPAGTRVVTTAEAATVASTMSSTVADLKAGARSTTISALPDEPAGKSGIGRTTMLLEIAKERGVSNRKWRGVLGAVAAIALVAVASGGYLFWKQAKNAEVQQVALLRVKQAAEAAADRAKKEAEQVLKDVETQTIDAAASLRKQLGVTPLDIIRRYGPATAVLEVKWKLFDRSSGRPVYQTIWINKTGEEALPLYIKLDDGTIVPFLTLDDKIEPKYSNMPIGGNVAGSSFVVSENGYLLTNRHMVAPWESNISYCSCYKQTGWLVEFTGGQNRKKINWQKLDLSNNDYPTAKWVPSDGGFLFDLDDLTRLERGAMPSARNKSSFSGRTEEMTIQFPKNALKVSANLSRLSSEADVALIKIDSPQKLAAVEIQEESPASAGERAIVLGYPEIAGKTFSIVESLDNGNFKQIPSLIPQPYISEGIVAMVSNKILKEGNITTAGFDGNYMQLTINSTGAGNSGGPVFNSAGKVIGIFALTKQSGNVMATGAVPIKYGIDLFKSQ